MSQETIAELLAWDEVDRLRKSLRIAGHNATSIAEALGVHRNTINNYLGGRIRPDRRTRMAWAMACGVPFRWLETGDLNDPNGGPGDGEELPRLESNQQPFGSLLRLVSGGVDSPADDQLPVAA